MTHAMYSFLKRSASSFSSTFCFFRGGGYTSLLLDSADTAIIQYFVLLLHNWNTMETCGTVQAAMVSSRTRADLDTGPKVGSRGTLPASYAALALRTQSTLS